MIGGHSCRMARCSNPACPIGNQSERNGSLVCSLVSGMVIRREIATAMEIEPFDRTTPRTITQPNLGQWRTVLALHNRPISALLLRWDIGKDVNGID